MTAPAIDLVAIDKRFGSVHANKQISLSIRQGSIHGIIGENGAGKSTLMSILYGFYEADSGTIRVNGKAVRIRRSADAIRAGIGMVHQHFMLVDSMTVAENVLLGAENGAFTAQSLSEVRREIERLGAEYGLVLDPDALVGELSVGLQQRVEIIKALYRGASVLILDEPTGVLTPAEAEQLFRVLTALKQQGRTILIITHKLKEIMAITDHVSVMRRGEMVAHRQTTETSATELAELMVGRLVASVARPQVRHEGEPLLRVENLTIRDKRGVTVLDDVSFHVKAGEIVGVAGISGNGQSELIEAITGMLRPSCGRIEIAGYPLPADADAAIARQLGVAHVPEDRHRMGLVTVFPAFENILLGHMDDPEYGAGHLIDRTAVLRDTAAKMQRFDVRPPEPGLKAANFSGGNQQKLVLAREIEANPQVLVVAQPTRGVDIGAIEFIHRQLMTLKQQGKAILLVSVELDEIFALSDRIIVLCAGRLVGVRETSKADHNAIGLLMAGIATQELASQELA